MDHCFFARSFWDGKAKLKTRYLFHTTKVQQIEDGHEMRTFLRVWEVENLHHLVFYDHNDTWINYMICEIKVAALQS